MSFSSLQTSPKGAINARPMPLNSFAAQRRRIGELNAFKVTMIRMEGGKEKEKIKFDCPEETSLLDAAEVRSAHVRSCMRVV